MIYGSVCSGIEAATVAWEPLGWKASFFSEIEKFPSAVLKHHYPDVYNLGDFTGIRGHWLRRLKNYEPIELLVGGTPCQSFSVAGKRAGMDDERGNLALEYIKLAKRLRPRWICWENVPGVFSSNKGEDFRCFLSALAGWNIPIPEGGWKNSGIINSAPGGYGVAWRVLDAQYAGVPQRRRRVFVIGYIGDWRVAAAVLFEWHSLQGHSPPSRKKREETTSYASSSIGGYRKGTGTLRSAGGGSENQILAHGQAGAELVKDGSPSLTCNHEAPIIFEPRSPDGAPRVHREVAPTLNSMGGGQREPCVAIPIHDKATRDKGGGEGRNNDGAGNGLGVGKDGDPCPTITGGDRHLVAFDSYNQKVGRVSQSIKSEKSDSDHIGTVFHNMTVRRLIPMECERLQGFPDDYTRIPIRVLKQKPTTKHFKKYPDYYNQNKDKTWTRYHPDSPRYKANGNSMHTGCMRWLGERIQMVEDLLKGLAK